MSSNLVHALESLRHLVRHVLDAGDRTLRPVTYGELSRRIERVPEATDDSFGLGMGPILGVMGHKLEEVSRSWNEYIPHLQSLVVLKRGVLKGLPDLGMDEFWESYPRLSLAAKSRKVRAEYEKIAAFGGRWRDVLRKLALVPLDTGLPVAPFIGRGGESESHKNLKLHVLSHPEIAGASGAFEAIPEYPLPSLDEIDVLFRSKNTCIAVEVKSRVSDRCPKDYERGIYQVVKYTALLAAMYKAGDSESRVSVRGLLVLEGYLPNSERMLAGALGVQVVEGIKPEIRPAV